MALTLAFPPFSIARTSFSFPEMHCVVVWNISHCIAWHCCNWIEFKKWKGISEMRLQEKVLEQTVTVHVAITAPSDVNPAQHLLDWTGLKWTKLNLQLSNVMLRTKVMCTPNRRWLPEHSKQVNAPKAREPGGLPGGGTMSDAHRGWRSGQSLQIWFSGLTMSAFSRFLNSAWLMMNRWLISFFQGPPFLF